MVLDKIGLMKWGSFAASLESHLIPKYCRAKTDDNMISLRVAEVYKSLDNKRNIRF